LGGFTAPGGENRENTNGKWESSPISRVLSSDHGLHRSRRAVIPLGAALPRRSSSLPGSSASHAIAPLFGLAPDGVCRAVRVATSAVSSYLAVSPLPDLLAEPSAVCSLLHFPSPHGARPLAGILLCGARTFLHAPEGAQRLPGELSEVDYTPTVTRLPERMRGHRPPGGRSRPVDPAVAPGRPSPAPGSARCWPDTSARPGAVPTGARPPRTPACR